MAIRYSGNVQVNMQYDQPRGCYLARVRDPNYRWRGTTGAWGRDASPTSETYDRLAKAAIARAERDLGVKLDAERDARGRVQLRRVFQAPCPSGKWEEF